MILIQPSHCSDHASTPSKVKKSKDLVAKWKALVRMDHDKENEKNTSNPEQCQICNEVFPSNEDIWIHLQNSHLKQKTLKIKLVKVSESLLKKYLTKSDTSLTTSKCPLCTEVFPNNKSIRIHLQYILTFPVVPIFGDVPIEKEGNSRNTCQDK